jgi:hypothetical protein
VQKSVSVYGGVAYLDSSGVSFYFPGNFLILFQQRIFRHFVANHSQVIVLHGLLFYVIQLDFCVVKVKTKIKLDYANAFDFGSPFPYIWRIWVATPVYLSLKCTLPNICDSLHKIVPHLKYVFTVLNLYLGTLNTFSELVANYPFTVKKKPFLYT